jgi:hypothetical protein
MQWLLLLLVLIVVFRYDQLMALFSGKKSSPEIDDKKNKDGEYIDYEELD